MSFEVVGDPCFTVAALAFQLLFSVFGTTAKEVADDHFYSGNVKRWYKCLFVNITAAFLICLLRSLLIFLFLKVASFLFKWVVDLIWDLLTGGGR